jgi:MFS family permease
VSFADGRLAAARRSLGAGPLAVRNFRLLAGGQFASTIGDFCYAVALPWLVLSSHGGPVLLGIVLACYGVPRTALIPVGGILADKVGSRTLMLTADAARCVLVATLAVLAARHTASLAALGPIAALIGAGEGLFRRATHCPQARCRPDPCSARRSAGPWWPPPIPRPRPSPPTPCPLPYRH